MEEVRTLFQHLDRNAEPSSEYGRFVAANEAAVRLCVPVLDKARASLSPEVQKSRSRRSAGKDGAFIPHLRA